MRVHATCGHRTSDSLVRASLGTLRRPSVARYISRLGGFFQPRRVNAYTWAHRARYRDVAQIRTLRRRGLGANDGIEQGRQVFGERFFRERRLTDDAMNDRSFIEAVFDFTRFDLAYRLLDVLRH